MIDNIENYLKTHFSDIDHHHPYEQAILQDFLQLGPLHFFIPSAMGGQFEQAETSLNVVETTSYYSLPLGLTLGITGSLFLLPLIKHADPDLVGPIVQDFLTSPALGGMMITEPTGGTDIFGLNTQYTQNHATLNLQGIKCWGGLTGKAGHWLVAARKKRDDKLTRKLDLLYVPLGSEGVSVHAYYDALGLQPITYGETHYTNVVLPSSHIMGQNGQSGLRTIYDTLFRSRMGMPAIAAGHCKRLAHEVSTHMSQRYTFGFPLSHYDQVKCRLSTLQGLYHMNHTLWHFTSAWMDTHPDISGDYTLVNSAKVVCSETMQMASDSALQIFASAAFKRNHIVGRAFVDSRPFQIFEGSNDVLNDNTYETIVSRQGSCDCESIHNEFYQYGLSLSDNVSNDVLDCFRNALNPTQRQKVLLGRIIAWLCILSILEHAHDKDSSESMDAQRVIKQSIAAIAACAPYLG